MDKGECLIVVVDDEPSIVQLLELVLADAGYSNVQGTTDPREVLRICGTCEPCLIITDLGMPHLHGYELIEQVREMYPDKAELPILVLTGTGEVEAHEKSFQLGANDFLIKPFDRLAAILRVQNLLEVGALHKEVRKYNRDLEQRVKDQTARLWTAVTRVEASEKQVRLAQEETVTRLSIAAEFRDDETARHIRRMSHYCGLLAQRCGMDRKRADLVRIASEMHDVGKIGIPDNILLKPGRLTIEERTIIEQHPEIGYRILRNSESEFLQVAASVALSHHERIDGKGYPHGLEGEEIPLEARIAAVADVFDALTTDRVYRKAFDLGEALKIMKEGRGTQFDADLLDLFLESMEDVIKIKNSNEDLSAPGTLKMFEQPSLTALG